MDVLKPDILVYEGIKYRVSSPVVRTQIDRNEESCFELSNQMTDLPEEESDDEIERQDDGRYKCRFHVAKTYFPYIIGQKGATRRRIETETASRINIPKFGHDGDIVITGMTKRSVASAKRRIKMLIISKKKLFVTHFISLPLNHSDFINGYLKFKTEVLDKFGNDRGVKESIFQIPDRLHITIGMLSLCDNIERQDASLALANCKSEVISPLLETNDLAIVMSGIEYMNDDPSEVDVLYGKVICVNDDQLLQNIADGISAYFSKRGLLERERGNVKLHATLMNTKFGKTEMTEASPKRETFNATNILKAYKDFYFGRGKIQTIELSLLHCSSKSGYYPSTAIIQIP